VLFGAISGSSVANVVASGSITIPMMRRVGYDRATAGAVEATSSTGGQITPPVLGAGAFLMAEITGIPYGEIALAAIIPCLLFYIACFLHVDLHARVNGLEGLPRRELPPLGALLRRAYLFTPLVVLVWTLMAGFSAFRAGTLGLLAAIVVSWIGRHGAIGPRRALEGLAQGARDSLQLVAVCACAGIIVGVIALTGLGGRVAQLTLSLAGESQIYALVFGMIVALVLGMGMPTTAAYAIAAAVVAPGLQRIGVPPLVAHMFIFYYAVLSSITPPVALASFAAAAIAKADPWRTSFISLKMGLATFIVPFMFFASPLLLGRGPLLAVLPSWRPPRAASRCSLAPRRAGSPTARVAGARGAFVAALLLITPERYGCGRPRSRSRRAGDRHGPPAPAPRPRCAAARAARVGAGPSRVLKKALAV
jgi:TRAP transporter 4TM/12TM fusion protein